MNKIKRPIQVCAFIVAIIAAFSFRENDQFLSIGYKKPVTGGYCTVFSEIPEYCNTDNVGEACTIVSYGVSYNLFRTQLSTPSVLVCLDQLKKPGYQ